MKMERQQGATYKQKYLQIVHKNLSNQDIREKNPTKPNILVIKLELLPCQIYCSF